MRGKRLDESMKGDEDLNEEFQKRDDVEEATLRLESVFAEHPEVKDWLYEIYSDI